MDPRSRRTHILVPVDFSSAAGKALQRAAEWAAQTASLELDVVHVVERGSGDAGGGTSSLPHFLSALERHAEAQVGTLRGPDGGPLAVRHHVAIGDPSAEILRLALSLSSDVIVMGAGQAGGELARNLATSAPCPVVLVAADGSAEDPARNAILTSHPLDREALAAASRLGPRSAPLAPVGKSKKREPS